MNDLELKDATQKIWDLMEDFSEIVTDHQVCYKLMALSTQIGAVIQQAQLYNKEQESDTKVDLASITLEERWEEEGMWMDVISKDSGAKTSFLKRYVSYVNNAEGKSYNNYYLPLERAMVCINLERDNINY